LPGTFNFALSVPVAPNNSYLFSGNSATSNFATWAAVTDGEFTITINGVAYDITGIDFTGVTDMDEVAAVIQAAVRTATGGTETVVWNNPFYSASVFLITAGCSISVTSAVGGGSGTDISGAGGTAFLDMDTGHGTVHAGTDIEFGLFQLNKNIKTVFKICGVNFYCITINEKNETETSVVEWDSDWTAAEAVYTIDWSGQGIKFEINGNCVAQHETHIVNNPLSVYLKNNNSSNLILGYLEGLGIESYI